VQTAITVTPERFAQGVSFDEYVALVSTPENLARPWRGAMRADRGPAFRAWYEAIGLNEHQLAALMLILELPNPPAKMLALSEDWSSDCRRDIPMIARLAEAGGMELRIFNRDGKDDPREPGATASPNADLIEQFLNRKRGQEFTSIPVVAFFTQDMEYLYHYTEYPDIYDKDRLVIDFMRTPRPGETPQETERRSDAELAELASGPFWHIWASAAVDQILSALHRKAVLGAA
jgi:hypothetical protein